MAQEYKSIDTNDVPEMPGIAEEGHRTKEPRVFGHNSEELAVVAPSRPARKTPSKARPVTQDDALFRLIGIGRSGISGGVSGKKHEALKRAYRVP